MGFVCPETVVLLIGVSCLLYSIPVFLAIIRKPCRIFPHLSSLLLNFSGVRNCIIKSTGILFEEHVGCQSFDLACRPRVLLLKP